MFVPVKPRLCLVIAIVVWGIEYPLMCRATRAVGFLATGAVMFGIAAALLGLTLLLRRVRKPAGVLPAQRRIPYGWLLLIGLVSVMVNFLGLWATKLTSPVNVATLHRTDILFSFLLSAFIFREVLERNAFLFLPVMLVGVCLLTGIFVQSPELGRPGDFIIIISAFFVSLNAFIIKRIVQHTSGLVVGFWNSAGNSITFFCSALVVSRGQNPFGQFPRGIWLILVLLGSLSYVFFATYNRALRFLPVWEVRLLCLAVPAVAAIFAWVLYREILTGWQTLGMILVSGGAAGIILLRSHRKAAGNSPLCIKS